MPRMEALPGRLAAFLRPQSHGSVWLIMVAVIAALIAFGDPDSVPAIVGTAARLTIVWCFGGVIVRAIEQVRRR